MSARELVGQAMASPKAASVVSAVTTGTGLGTILDLIPNDIGKLATLVGIVLSVVLIQNHWRKGRAEYTKLQLEIKVLKRQEAERSQNAVKRKKAGLPVRRGED